jgi:polar amino acid transport system substrate-binding protein
MSNIVFLKVFVSVFLILLSASVKSVELNFITLEVAPWAYKNSYGVVSGVFPDIVHELEKETGYSIKVTLAPFGFSRIVRELEAGRQDCTMIIEGKKREGKFFLGERVVDLPVGVIAKKNIILNDYNDLKGLKVSVHKALEIVEGFTQDPLVKKEYDSGYEFGLRKIYHGRVDAVAGVLPTIKYLATEVGMEDILGFPLVLKKEPIYLQCSKKIKDVDYIKKLNKVIVGLRNSLAFKEIMKKNNMLFEGD